MINTQSSVAHANELNAACIAKRDFSLINWTGGSDPRISAHSRMMYSSDVDFAFDSVGGFFARHLPTGIIEYAYPTSDSARHARKAPLATAMRMLQGVWDHFEYYQSRAFWAESAKRRAQQFAECAKTSEVTA